MVFPALKRTSTYVDDNRKATFGQDTCHLVFASLSSATNEALLEPEVLHELPVHPLSPPQCVQTSDMTW